MTGSRFGTIFLVDDEPIIASTSQAILMHAGFDATAITDPLLALAALQSDSPDLLITDVSMPVMNGIELAIRFKSECPSCKVLLFSGQAGTLALLEQAELQGHNFKIIGKPLHPLQLIEAAKSMLPALG